ncbi:ABC transporter permease subunit [Rhodoblastus sp.]|uniref:ABC transporter permease subunit n=1 Tax=Rhodoblastus sp. TaxID=1962975 RepID=UPI002623D94F|nr:ABC transporter permease subunit [Rhodoblastus sp.]
MRRLAIQAGLALALGLLLGVAYLNARKNLHALGIPTSFAFLRDVAGFSINQSLISFSPLSTYGRALLVGLLNTLLVSVLAGIFATLIGFVAGFAHLSRNFALSRLVAAYVGVVRNLPLLLQLLFCYVAVLAPLPGPADSHHFAGFVLNDRGLYAPALSFVHGWPAIDWSSFDPALNRFNVVGGWRLSPEACALVLALSVYTGAYIAEIVSAGVESVARGQSEAAAALGLSPAQARRLVIRPQAMRVILPPLISQYLAMTKNSSLAAFVGFADLMQVSGTILNQTGAALQVMALVMALYLALSLVTLALTRLYERRLRWGGRT